MLPRPGTDMHRLLSLYVALNDMHECAHTCYNVMS
jgi:hypothetical protein